MSWYVVMLVTTTKTPDIFGPYRAKKTAQLAADRWNRANNDPSDPEEEVRARVQRIALPGEFLGKP